VIGIVRIKILRPASFSMPLGAGRRRGAGATAFRASRRRGGLHGAERRRGDQPLHVHRLDQHLV